MSDIRRICGYLLVFGMLLMLLALGLNGCDRKREVSGRDQATATAYYRLAVNSYQGGDTIEALKALNEAKKYNPNDPEIKNLYGIIYLFKGMLDEAEASFKDAIEIDEKYSDAYLNLSSVYMAREQWQKAVEVLQVPVNDLMYRGKAMAYDNLGWSYHKLGDSQKALQSLMKATAEDPNLCHAWYNMGLVYKDNSRYTDAMRAFATLLEKEKCANSSPVVWYHYGVVAMRAKDFERARTALEKCIELGGSSLEASECNNYYQMLK